VNQKVGKYVAKFINVKELASLHNLSSNMSYYLLQFLKATVRYLEVNYCYLKIKEKYFVLSRKVLEGERLFRCL
jgi:hypothetical protein